MTRNPTGFIRPGGHIVSQNLGAPMHDGYYEDQCLCKEVCTSDFFITLRAHGVWLRGRKLSFYGREAKVERICYRGDPDLDLPDDLPGVCFENVRVKVKRHTLVGPNLEIRGRHSTTKYLGAVDDCSSCHPKMDGGCLSEEKLRIKDCSPEKLTISRDMSPGWMDGAGNMHYPTTENCIERGCRSARTGPLKFTEECDLAEDAFGEHQELFDLLGVGGGLSNNRILDEEDYNRIAAQVQNPDSAISKLLCKTLLTLRCCCNAEGEENVDDAECPRTFEPCCNCESPVQETE